MCQRHDAVPPYCRTAVLQTTAKYEERLAAQKRELEGIAASMSGLRSERDRVSAAGEAATR